MGEGSPTIFFKKSDPNNTIIKKGEKIRVFKMLKMNRKRKEGTMGENFQNEQLIPCSTHALMRGTESTFFFFFFFLKKTFREINT